MIITIPTTLSLFLMGLRRRISEIFPHIFTPIPRNDPHEYLILAVCFFIVNIILGFNGYNLDKSFYLLRLLKLSYFEWLCFGLL
jgi:hypothetical protein